MSELNFGPLASRRHLVGCVSIVFLAWFAQRASLGQEWRERILSAKADFRPIDSREVDLAATRVGNALLSIKRDAMVGPGIREGWERYLLWEEQERQLPQRPVGLDFWKNIYLKVASNANGLEHRCFREYRQALRELIDAAESAEHADLQGEFERTLDAISKLVPDNKEPNDGGLSSEEADRLTQLLTLLQRRRQALPLVQTIRNRYAHPNIVALISDAMIQEAVSGELDEEFEVNSTVRGASVQGTGRLRASQDVQMPRDADDDALRIALSGTSVSDTTSYQDGVRVRSHSVLTFDSTSSILFRRTGIDVEPFETKGTLRSDIQGISTSYSGLRNSRARQSVYARQQADRHVAERQAIDDLNAAFTRKLTEFVEPLNTEYLDNVRTPLLRFDKFPQEIHSSVDSSGVTVRCIAGDSHQLAAPHACPPFPRDMALAFGVHQSAINNTFTAMLSSRTMSLSSLMRQQFSPARTADAAENNPLYITFNDRSPVHVSFEGGVITIAYSGASYRYREHGYSGMDILLRFRPERTGQAYELVQSREPEVVLPKTDDGTRPKLGIRDYALRRILSNVLKREVPSRVLLCCDTPWPTITESIATVSFIDIEDGWLRLGVSIDTKVSEEPNVSVQQSGSGPHL